MYIVKSRAFRPTFHTFSYLCDIDICKIKVDNSVKIYRYGKTESKTQVRRGRDNVQGAVPGGAAEPHGCGRLADTPTAVGRARGLQLLHAGRLHAAVRGERTPNKQPA